MKRNFLMITVALGLLIPMAAFVASSGASVGNHGPKGDPSSTCGGSNGSKPGGCDNSNLPQSDGCLHGQAPNQNPHCAPTQTTTTTTTTTTTPVTTPVTGVQGQQGQQVSGNKAAGGNAGVAAAPSALPFTGIDATLLALMGGLLLTAGLGLRRLSRAPEPAMSMFVAGPAGRGDESLPFRPFMG